MRFCRPILLAAIAGSALAATPALAGEAYTLPQIDIGEGLPDTAFDSHGAADVDWESVHDGSPQSALPYPAPMAMPGQPTMHPGAGLPPQPSTQRLAYGAEEREDWLRECRRRYTDSDDGLGGALIGGVLGGVAGNVIAGKGNRTVGTVVGAAAGGVAGAAIDRGEDRGKARDFCEDYLARYEAGAQGGYGSSGYAYGGQVMWVPTVVGWNCKPREKIVEEWVEERPARRAIPKKTKYVPAKTKMVPVKTKNIKSVK